MANPDAETLWELQCRRREGYEACLIVFRNDKGHLRVKTTLDTAPEVVELLTELLTRVDNDPNDTTEIAH